ncbi:DUF4335 domain-containing protein [Ancylothrix sp. C2]|uniref:DUF4335 domain-containing protein n=1 Tax=Ancylothrix sp. D3o TaxID=2953691 RepID=UPI0021BB4B8B|nr:DUF4335 domain-containing protein [Ancylothrix sp. D3o]MCT7951588.1 DUF4335 domain-containing protein [Ancylothrix sp. D3o]
MTIQRQYSLPNCTLFLEGLSDAPAPNPTEFRPLMSMLINAECRFAGVSQSLSGGREFFEGLVKAVSTYAQQFLSGVPHLDKSNNLPAPVELRPSSGNLHRLIVRPTDKVGSGSPIELDLTTVQLFDLVEAIDQFLADTRTLPELSVPLVPVSKRDIQTSEPLAKRAIPAAIGVSSLAAAAIAFSFMPIPEVRRPEEPQPQTSSQTQNTPNAVAAGTPDPTSSTPPASEAGTPEPTSSTPPASDIQTTLASVPEITEPAKLEDLNSKLFDQLDKEWQQRNLAEELSYRVTVGGDGAIIGYKPVNDAATNAKETPLLNLLYLPPGGGQATPESYADFKVVFTPRGALQVSPWKGFNPPPAPTPTPTPTLSPSLSPAPSPTPTTSSSGSEITDPAQLESLQQQLYGQIHDNWKTKPSFERELTFKVGISSDGKIVEYEPLNQPASDYVNETPLGNLKQLTPGGSQQAHYRVVFTPQGVLQVSPWKGFR